MTASDTIFAQSSGAGRAGIAVIRVSGPRASAILEACASSLPRPRELTLRSIRDPDSGEMIDKAAVIWLPAPRSFTGEDCAEFHLHGSPAVIKAFTEVLGRHPDTRPADAGEFTRRAFMNDKLDLVEVEGLGDLLDAQTTVQRRQALRQMTGEASSVFECWRRELLLARADLEAVLDFSDESGVADAATLGIDARLRKLRDVMSKAVADANRAELVREGVRVVLAGLPNTGKSSLLNSLAKRDAAIVSETAGTTRDVIEVTLDFNGVPVILTDTAGLRSSEDVLEQEGIRRARQHISAADVLVWVWSADVPGSEHPDPEIAPDVYLRNKCDQASILEVGPRQSIPTSSVTEGGLLAFVAYFQELIDAHVGHEEAYVVTSARQKAICERTIRYLNEMLREDVNLELKSELVRMASSEVGRLAGRVDVEEWLGVIFSRFCIGK